MDGTKRCLTGRCYIRNLNIRVNILLNKNGNFSVILIADGGATKTEWCVLSASGVKKIKTPGISPYFLNTDQIVQLLRSQLLPEIQQPENIADIHYYGTGCTAPQTSKVIADALEDLFPEANTEVSYDLVGAAHALCGNDAGIACILGTGSSSGYYNGKGIEKNIPGLGYVLGDEGSGAYLGKMFATHYLYNKIDTDLRLSFEHEFDLTPDTLLYKVYSEPFANQFFASFSHFLSRNMNHPQLSVILRKGINDFFDIHLSEYDQRHHVPVHFTGSISTVYSDIIRQLCSEHQFTCGNIMKDPIDGLIDYYLGRNPLNA